MSIDGLKCIDDFVRMKEAYQDLYSDDEHSLAADISCYMPKEYFTKIVKGIQERGDDVKMLDIGCGEGKYSFLGKTLGVKKIYAFDIYDDISFKDEIFDYIKMSMDDVPWPYDEKSFNLVNVQSCIYYSQDIRSVLSEIARVVDANGYVIITGHTKYSIYSLERKIRLLLKRREVNHLLGATFRATGEYIAILKELGFEIIIRDGWKMFIFNEFIRAGSLLSRIFHFKYNDPRFRLDENSFRSYIRSNLGYHFLLVAKKTR